MEFLIPLPVALAFAWRAIPGDRFGFWKHWSWTYALLSTVSIVAVLYGISAAGVLAAAKGAPGLNVAGQFGAAVAAQASLRRGLDGGERGHTLALGWLRYAQRWPLFLLQNAIRVWATKLDDCPLEAASALLDRKRKSRRASLEVRVRNRELVIQRIGQGGLARDEARADLIDAIVDGYVIYELRRDH